MTVALAATFAVHVWVGLRLKPVVQVVLVITKLGSVSDGSEVMTNGAVPVLVSVAVWLAVVVPTGAGEKVRLGGDATPSGVLGAITEPATARPSMPIGVKHAQLGTGQVVGEDIACA